MSCVYVAFSSGLFEERRKLFIKPQKNIMMTITRHKTRMQQPGRKYPACNLNALCNSLIKTEWIKVAKLKNS